MERYLRIARLYWRYHRRWYVRTGDRMPSRLGWRESRQAHRLARDPKVLPFLIEALVATARREADLPFIGIDLLEDAYRATGSEIFEAFKKARLIPYHRNLILSGCWPSTLSKVGVSLKPLADGGNFVPPEGPRIHTD